MVIEMKIEQIFTDVAHPQANGQVEVINIILLDGLKKRLEHEKTSWVEELPSVLWVYRTTPRSTTGETPLSMVFGNEAVVSAELCTSTRKKMKSC